MSAREERFWSRVEGGDFDECWIWHGYRNGPDDYGRFWDGTRNVLAHRWAYQAMVGEIPEGLQLDHLCRNRPCVNPWHLEPVTNRVNTLRAYATPGREYDPREGFKECPKGHPLNAQTRMRGSDCRECENKRGRVTRDACALCGREMRRDSLPRHRRKVHGFEEAA